MAENKVRRMIRRVDRKYYDHRNTEIKIGDEVAYNFSGEIAVGEVVEIKIVEKKYWDGYRPFPRIKILQKYPEQYRNSRYSTVTSSKNLLVLKNSKRSEHV